MRRNIQKTSYYNEEDPQDSRCPLCGANIVFDSHTRDCPIRTVDCAIRVDEEFNYEY